MYICSNLFGSLRFTLTRKKLYLKIRAIRYIGIRVEYSMSIMDCYQWSNQCESWASFGLVGPQNFVIFPVVRRRKTSLGSHTCNET